MFNFAPINFEEAGSGGKSKVAKALGVSDEQWKHYREWMGMKESTNRYDIMGGANNHYAGRYQMGKMAIADAARILGKPVPDTQTFLNNPKMQDEFFEAYTLANISYMNKDKNFRKLPPGQQMEILGYAHNQGHGGAKDYLRTGQVGKDAFGTPGSDYFAAGRMPDAGAPEMGLNTQAPAPVQNVSFETPQAPQAPQAGIDIGDIAGQPRLGAVGAPAPEAPMAPQAPAFDMTPIDFENTPIDFSAEAAANVPDRIAAKPAQMANVGSGDGSSVEGFIARPGEAMPQSQAEADALTLLNKPKNNFTSGTDAGRAFSEWGSGTIENIPSSAGKYVSDLANAVYNYDDTAEGLKQLGLGVASMAGITEDNPEAEKVAAAVGEFYKERYGSPEKVIQTMHDDPVGFFADAMTVLWGGAGLATGAARATAKAGQVANRTGVAAKAGQASDALSKATSIFGKSDPIRAITAPIGAAAKAGRKVAGLTTREIGGFVTGAGSEALSTAYQTSKARAAKSFSDPGLKAAEKALLSQMRGSSKTEFPAEMARRGFDAIKKESKRLRDAGLDQINAEVAAAQQLAPLRPDAIKRLSKKVRNDFYTNKIDEFTPKDARRWKQVKTKLNEVIKQMKKSPAGDTVKNWDAAKRAVRGFYKGDGSKADAAIARLADDIKGEIVKVAPKYQPLMRQTEEALGHLKELEAELSLGPKANIGQPLRKLQSALRAGAHQGWEYRVDLVKYLQDAGAPNLWEALSGQALKPALARGLSRYVLNAGGAQAGGLAAISAGSGVVGTAGAALAGLVTALIGTSPRVWGEAATALGTGAGLASRANRVSKPLQRAAGRAAFQGGRLEEEGIFDKGMF